MLGDTDLGRGEQTNVIIVRSPKGVRALPRRTHSIPFRPPPPARVAVALQAHMPAVHPEMMIWGVKGGPPPLFLG